jgi:hypothetical protein
MNRCLAVMTVALCLAASGCVVESAGPYGTYDPYRTSGAAYPAEGGYLPPPPPGADWAPSYYVPPGEYIEGGAPVYYGSEPGVAYYPMFLDFPGSCFCIMPVRYDAGIWWAPGGVIVYRGMFPFHHARREHLEEWRRSEGVFGGHAPARGRLERGPDNRAYPIAPEGIHSPAWVHTPQGGGTLERTPSFRGAPGPQPGFQPGLQPGPQPGPQPGISPHPSGASPWPAPPNMPGTQGHPAAGVLAPGAQPGAVPRSPGAPQSFPQPTAPGFQGHPGASVPSSSSSPMPSPASHGGAAPRESMPAPREGRPPQAPAGGGGQSHGSSSGESSHSHPRE